VYTSITKLKVN